MSSTFSKTLDCRSTSSQPFRRYDSCGAQNPFDLQWWKALIGLDFPHDGVHFTSFYESPFFRPSESSWTHSWRLQKPVGTWRFSIGQLWTPTERADSSAPAYQFYEFLLRGASAAVRSRGNTRAAWIAVGACTDPRSRTASCGLLHLYCFDSPLGMQFLRHPQPSVRFAGFTMRTILPFLQTRTVTYARNPASRCDQRKYRTSTSLRGN